MKNSADLGGCYPPRPSASVDNTLLDLQNSSYPTKAEFNNCSISFAMIFVFQLFIYLSFFNSDKYRGLQKKKG